MKAYLNHDDRSKVLMVIAFLAVLEELEERERLKQLFGKAFSDIKRAKSFTKRALEGLADVLGPEQSKKIHNMAKAHDVAVIGRAAPRGKSEVSLEVDALYNLAELVIGDECGKCTKQDHKSCELFQALQAADIPPADTKVTNDCPYRQ